jgi:hypothetical protein
MRNGMRNGMHDRLRRVVTGVAVFSMALGATLGAQTFDAGMGRSLFDDGQGRDGRNVIGRVASGTVPMQGGAVACANCHGKTGTGGGEGWVDAPDIRWFALSKPYGARRPGGEARPPYDRASFAKALRTGHAPDGVALDPSMPRFDLADDEIDALISHLSRLSEDAHRDGERPALVVLMPQTPTPAAERLLRGLQTCPTASIDGQSPRTLPALRVMRFAAFAEIDAQLAGMGRDGSAVALLAPYLIGAERDFAGSASRMELPAILPMAMRDVGADARMLFAMPGLRAQAQALIAAPAASASNRLAIVLDVEFADDDALVRELIDFARRAGWRAQSHRSVEEALATHGIDALLMLTNPTAPPRELPSSLRLWVPAAYVVPPVLDAWSKRGVAVRIALPYPPTVGGDARWIPPADAWVAVGCELIARLPPLPQQRDGVEAWREALAKQPDLRLGDWLHLPAVADADDAASRVHLATWPPAPVH